MSLSVPGQANFFGPTPYRQSISCHALFINMLARRETLIGETIFARAKPQKVRIVEKYGYRADISANQYTEHSGTPTGQFSMLIPYDGEKYFTSQAVADIDHQLSSAWSQNQLDARIGYIGLSNYTNTDLEQQSDLHSNYNVIPINVPVQLQGTLIGRDSLWDDRHACQIKQEYVPKWPESTPLELKVYIFDEDIISELQLGEVLDKIPDELVKQVVDSIAQQVGFKRSLIFSFNLALGLPGVIGRANDNAAPVLTRMAINWPVATSHRLVRLMIRKGRKEKEAAIQYDPERGVIEWGDISFLPPKGKSEGTNLFTYWLPPMLLIVEQPGELYQQEFLNGEIEIRIPRLFSGLRVDTFGADGSRSEIQRETETILNTQISISLEDCFERKTFSPYQHLQFEGVILNDMRINDIKTLLEDNGFKCDSRQLQSGSQGTQRYIVVGVKTKELEELRLWMLVEGLRSRTTRQKQIPGGQTFTTEVDSGHMVIYMRGELQGSSNHLVHSMNEIQKHLKERFRHVSTID